jgi:hypothetical protein
MTASVMIRLVVRILVVAASAFALHAEVLASGHGPLFGGATPVLGKGGWSFDSAWMARSSEDAFAQTLRTMISFGVTEDVQISGSVPFDIGTHPPLPGARMMAMMSSQRELEMLAAWRVHTRPIGVGGRFETTVFAGATYPLAEGSGVHELTPSVIVSAATGFASRGHYFWVGGGHQQYLERDNGRPSNVTSYSVVYGYRPPSWRLEYPKPDVRVFAELVGERIGHARHHGVTNQFSGGNTIFVGPTVLALYKAYALEAGVLFPVYRNLRISERKEHLRVGVNFAYFFWTR